MQVFVAIVARATIRHSVAQAQHVEANAGKLTAEFEGQVASDVLAELRRLVAAVAAVVVAVAQKLSRHAHRVGALPFERRASAAIQGLRAVGLVRRVGAVLATVAPEVGIDAYAVVAFTLSDTTWHASTIPFVGTILAIKSTVAHF